MQKTESMQAGCFKTKISLLWMNLSSEPLIAIYSLIPIILRKEFGATTFQISLFAILSPVLSVFSFYWGSWLTARKHRLLPNLVGAWILARVPFLFFSYIDTFWAMLACCSIYQIFSRAATPALMEILKRNIPGKTREHVFSLYYVLSVIEGIVIGFLLTQVLTICDNNWRLLFLICSVLSLTSIFSQLQIKMGVSERQCEQEIASCKKSSIISKQIEKLDFGPCQSPSEEQSHLSPISNRECNAIALSQGVFTSAKKQLFSAVGYIVQPLKESFSLLFNRKDFAVFQWGFMIGGFALMLIAPVRSIFIADTLQVSLSDITTARCVFVGIGMAGSSLIWKKALEIYGVHRLTAWILIGFGFYPLFLLLASLHTSWFYFSHLVYGIAQGGSHLVWHLSGAIFAKEENSTPFTTLNVLMIGLRGLIGPVLGGLLCYACGPVIVLLLGTAIGLFGGWFMLNNKLHK